MAPALGAAVSKGERAMGLKEKIIKSAPVLSSIKRSLNEFHPIFSYPFGDLLSATNDVRKNIRCGRYPLLVEYPVQPEPRFGWGKPAHSRLREIIDRHRSRYSETITKFRAYQSGFRQIPGNCGLRKDVPHWENPWLQALDAISLYAMPAILNSRRYVEIGSGESTKFVRRSISDNNLTTSITSIDPHPRAEIETQCDTSIREPLERTVFDFSSLDSGDILMFDGSHRCFQNSDVTVFFTEILPQLKEGVSVFIHDIFLPYDYRPEWRYRWFSEQYLLAVLLMNDLGRRYEIVLPCLFVDLDERLRTEVEQLWADVGHDFGLPIGATGFWLRVGSD